MQLHKLKPRKALNKAYLKVKPNRSEIEDFKSNLVQLLDRTNDTESEEFHKNLVIDFLKKTYYDTNHFVNTKGRNDLVIHNGDKAKSSVGVILEAKKPTNKSEMISTEKINAKAFQELVLYYLRERITLKNLEVKHLVITNINEWFIFDAVLFDRLFAQNKNLVKQFNDFEAGRLSDTKTDFFYKQIAEPFISEIKQEIEFTYFNLQEYQKPLRNENKADDRKLIALFKLLSPEHLLKLPFSNDSNSLDKRFYSELLHIIGLTETKEGSKKLIGRNKEGERNSGSILEDAIIQLDSMDKINRLENPGQFGNTHEEKLFNVGLELSITWINRILFLKLLEAQLNTYHKGDKSYAFLNFEKIKNYDDLNALFFQVLAKQHDERNQDVKQLFEKVPYLNSSLFEATDIEHATLFISNLKDEKTIPIISSTVLKNEKGKKRTGKLTTLEYLFEFLNAYDFSSENSEEIQEENKTLINASVLGLIFEKINGYKDGSFFTPGFITMYMCRETIRKAVLQKFNESKSWDCKNIDELYDKIEDRAEANKIVNSIKICDPAVGSGHFLVSALNELIAVKNDLKILQDREGKRLKEYQVEVVNDDLIVTDEEGELFEYNPNSKESQRVQETLFHEKQVLIENCLFGVDINPNSVKICRLRLWIELLKNAYYRPLPSPPPRGGSLDLQTLPNIDINIKCGNSLVSRFAIDADLKQALKKSKWSIDSYRVAVDTYRNAESKEQKREMERLIADIKSDFRSEISSNDPKVKRLTKLQGELFLLTQQPSLFEMSKKEKTAWNKKVAKLTTDTKKLETDIEAIKANKIFENAFEWRFEFPEVLDDNGNFIGFDVVIGNPPYIQLQKMKEESEKLSKLNYETFIKTGDIYSLFYELGFKILRSDAVLTYITSNKWMRAAYGKSLRSYFVEKCDPIQIIDFGGTQVFDTATVDTNILIAIKRPYKEETSSCVLGKDFSPIKMSDYIRQNSGLNRYYSESWVILPEIEQKIREKIERFGTPLKEWDISINYGIKTGLNEAFIINGEKKEELIRKSPNSAEIIRPILRGRDINKYQIHNNNLFLINAHNGIKINGIPPVDLKKDHPHIFNYLSNFLPQIENRYDKGVHWSNLRNCAYLQELDKVKIIWPRLMRLKKNIDEDFPRFALDMGENIILDSMCFITGQSLKVILAYLNSKFASFYFKQNVPVLDNGGMQMRQQYVESFLLPKTLSSEIIDELNYLVDQIIIDKNEEAKQKIDNLVYRSFNFSEEEILLINEKS